MPKVRDLTSQDESYVKGMRRKRSGKKRPRSSNRESLHKNHRQTLSSDDTKALPPVVQSPLSEKTTIRGSTSRSKMSTDNAIRVYDTPRGVAFDTRCPDTDDGRKCSKEVLHLYSTFLRNIRDRGALPHVTVITEGSTKYMNSKNQENVTVQVHFKTAEEIQEELPTEGHFPFESSAIPVVHDTKENAVSASSGSAAKTAWKVLGNIAKDTIQHASEGGNSSSVMVISSDLALMMDPNMVDQKTAIHTFLKKFQQIIQENKQLSSFLLVVYITGSLVHIHGENTTQSFINLLHEANEKMKEETVLGSIRIKAINCQETNALRLAEEWTLEAYLERYVEQPRLIFELPETATDAACLLSFDMNYFVQPFALSTPESLRHQADLVRLSRSNVKVIQSVPLSTIEAQFTFGTPIRLSAASNGLGPGEENIEMKACVSAFFKILADQDLGLVLEIDSTPFCDTDFGLFVPGCNRLLLAPCLASSQEGPVCMGILKPLASKSQIIWKLPGHVADAENDEFHDQETVGILESLVEGLPCREYHPLVDMVRDTHTTHTTPSTVSTTMEESSNEDSDVTEMEEHFAAASLG